MDMKTIMVSAAVAAATSASVAVAFVGYVTLQTSFPGTADSGNLNITGLAKVGRLRIGTNNTGGAKIWVEDSTGSGGLYTRSTGNGIYAENTATSGALIGGQFVSRSTTGRGIIASATATSGTTRGGIFDSKSTTGVGIFGISSAVSGTGVGVYGSASTPTATAIVASNPTASETVELAGPNGAAYLGTGNLTKDFGSGVRDAAPIAYGYVLPNGTLQSNSGNVACSWDGSRYVIAITGESYYFSNYVTVVTAGDVPPDVFSTSSVGGDLLVYCYDLAGSVDQQYFQFVVYKAVGNANYPSTPAHGFKDDVTWARKRPQEAARFQHECRLAEDRALSNTRQSQSISPY